jgi:hypothetical protein
VALRADGVGAPHGVLHLDRPARSVAVDVFLRPSGPPRAAPVPGPTVAVVLSHAEAGRTVRLRPEHDVRGEAVRFRLSDATRARIASTPGAWRVRAQADGRPLAEAAIDVPA